MKWALPALFSALVAGMLWAAQEIVVGVRTEADINRQQAIELKRLKHRQDIHELVHQYEGAQPEE